MTEKELQELIAQAEQRGFEKGVRYVKNRIVSACDNGTPLEVDGVAYFIKDAISNLRDIFDDLEADAE